MSTYAHRNEFSLLWSESQKNYTGQVYALVALPVMPLSADSFAFVGWNEWHQWWTAGRKAPISYRVQLVQTRSSWIYTVNFSVWANFPTFVSVVTWITYRRNKITVCATFASKSSVGSYTSSCRFNVSHSLTWTLTFLPSQLVATAALRPSAF